MLNYIYNRLLVVLEIVSRTDRRLKALEEGQARIEAELERLIEAVIPEPAVSVKLSPGPIEEQPL